MPVSLRLSCDFLLPGLSVVGSDLSLLLILTADYSDFEIRDYCVYKS